MVGIGIGDPRLKSSYPLNVGFFKIAFIFGIRNGFSSWARIEEVETDSCDPSLSTSRSGRDLRLFSISLYSRSDLSLSKSYRFRDLNRSFRAKSYCEPDGLGIRDLLEPKGVTLVREDEGDGVVGGEVDGVVILVGEGDGGGDGGGGLGGITNPVGIFIPPAKLSLISFNNFITPSS